MTDSTDAPYPPHDEIIDMEKLLVAYREAMPGSPRRSQLAEYCIVTLMQRRIDDLKEKRANDEG